MEVLIERSSALQTILNFSDCNASYREKIMRMSHDEALKVLIKMSKIESKIKIIQSVYDSGLFGVI